MPEPTFLRSPRNLRQPPLSLKNKTALCWDNGIFFEFALLLAHYYGKVYYCTPYADAYPGMSKAVIGSEWVDGKQLDTFDGKPVERIINPWDYIDEVDIVIFPDCYDEDLQTYLKRKGKPVFGALKGAELELHRFEAKETFKRHGMDVPAIERIVGIGRLRAYLQNPENERAWIKIGRYRKHFETFHHASYAHTEPVLEKLEWELGVLKNITEFVVERDVEALVEEGVDTYSVDGQLPSKMVQGTEIKDACYACAFFDCADLSKGNQRVNEKLSGVLAETGYQGLISTEIRTTADGKNYLIDPCTRAGFPSLNAWMTMCGNMGEITWEVGHGRMVEPIVRHKYGIEVIVRTDWALQNHQSLRFPAHIRDYVKIKNVLKIDGKYHALNLHDTAETGSVVATGNSFNECIEVLRDLIPQVAGFGLSLDAGAIDQAVAEFNKMAPPRMVSIPASCLSRKVLESTPSSSSDPMV